MAITHGKNKLVYAYQSSSNGICKKKEKSRTHTDILCDMVLKHAYLRKLRTIGYTIEEAVEKVNNELSGKYQGLSGESR